MLALPQVSVIVPCFNAERYIGATLRSILAQSGTALEVIVVDDGSTDGSAALVEREFPTVRLLKRTNAGVAAARNTGIAEAKGDWIAFCDADDIWLPGKLAAQLQASTELDGCRMSYTGWHVWMADTAEPPPELMQGLQGSAASPALPSTHSGWIYPELLLDCVVWTSTVMMTRGLLAEIGVFDPSLRIGEDYDLWLRASRVTPVARVPQPLALYRQHASSITRSAPKANYRGRVLQSALDRWGLSGPDGRAANAHAVRQALAGSWSEYAYTQLEAGQKSEARRSALQALRVQPRQTAAWKVWLKSWFFSDRRSVQ